MRRGLVALAMFLLAAGPACALESAPVHSARATATLVSETDSVAPGKPLRLALRLAMAPGWHTYWSNPGDSGLPTAIDWLLPPDFKAASGETEEARKAGIAPKSSVASSPASAVNRNTRAFNCRSR